MKKILFPFTWKNLGYFILIGLFIGFSLGLSTLMGPLRILVDLFRKAGIPYWIESLSVKVIIVSYAVLSAAVAAWFVRIIHREKRWRTTTGYLSFSILAGASAYWLMINPEFFTLVSGDIRSSSHRFAFGGFPDEAKMRELKKEGFTGILSLLDTNLPPERALLAKEKERGKEVGIEIIHLPMIPWIGDEQNKESLEKARELAESGVGRYYVHCYLGMDRVGLVKRTVESVAGTEGGKTVPASNNLANFHHVSHGEVIDLLPNLLFTPMLTKEEWIRYVISGSTKQVISILDPTQSVRAASTNKLLNSYFIPTHDFPINLNPYNPQQVLKYANKVKQLERPLIVYDYDVLSPRAEAFIQSFISGKPSLPPSLFKEPLSKGPVAVTRTNIAIGPKPTPEEIESYLKPRGIVKPLYIEKGKKAPETGGPYYLYGPGVNLNSLGFIDHFESGPIRRLLIDVYLTPKPNRLEFKKYFVEGEAKSHIHLDMKIFNPDEMLELARKAWKMPRPLIIRSDTAWQYEAFLQAFTSNLPPLPPALFNVPLIDGEIEVVAPNIAIGPHPTYDEFLNYFPKRGITHFAYLGNPNSKEGIADKRYVESKGLTWEAINFDRGGYIKPLSKPGPFYLYGPDAALNLRVARKFGPELPQVVIKYPKEAIAPPPTTKTGYSIASFEKILERYIPSVEMIILLAPSLFLITLFASRLVGYLRNKRHWIVPYTRKTFHFLIFCNAGLILLFMHISALTTFGTIVALFVLHAIIKGRGFPLHDALARPTDYPHKKHYILIPLISTAAGGFFSYLFFGPFAAVGIFASGWGDAVGEVAGRRFGKHRYRVRSILGNYSSKTLEGTTSIFIVSYLAGLFALTFLGVGITSTAWIALIIATVSCIVEAISSHGIDNFTVQLTTTAVAFFLA